MKKSKFISNMNQNFINDGNRLSKMSECYESPTPNTTPNVNPFPRAEEKIKSH